MAVDKKKPPSSNNPARLSSRKAAQLRRKRAQRRKQLIIWGSISAGIVVVVALIIFVVLPQIATTDISGVVSYSNLSRNHVNGTVNYPQSPPVGGDHNPIWQNCGIYDKPIANENGVHSLEHGAVWITYQPDLPSSAVEQLRNDVRGKAYTLLSPYTGLSSPVVATAWGLQLKLNDASDPRLAQFIKTYAGGPQTPEPGALCSGGIGNPIG
jgi:hypothetical protein